LAEHGCNEQTVQFLISRDLNIYENFSRYLYNYVYDARLYILANIEFSIADSAQAQFLGFEQIIYSVFMPKFFLGFSSPHLGCHIDYTMNL